MNSRTALSFGALTTLSLSLAGCTAIKTIFKAGMWVGVLGVLGIVVLAVLAINMFRR